ncbi:MAG: hypothetical protein PVI23_14730 [Maricaulaceae bacterium]
MVLIIAGVAVLWHLQNKAQTIASQSDEARMRYLELPFGVPAGTVRGLAALLVIVLGLAVLVVQNQLGIESGEAVAGFITAVITFYFVTRQQTQTEEKIDRGAQALDQATTTLTRATTLAATKGLANFDLPDDALVDFGLKVARARGLRAAGEPRGPLERDKISYEVQRIFRDLVKDRVDPYDASRKTTEVFYEVAVEAKTYGVQQALEASDYLKAYAKDFQLDVYKQTKNAMKKTLGHWEMSMADEVCADLISSNVIVR